MLMQYVSDWDKIKDRFKAFWANDVLDRCCVSVTAQKQGASYICNRRVNTLVELVGAW